MKLIQQNRNGIKPQPISIVRRRAQKHNGYLRGLVIRASPP